MNFSLKIECVEIAMWTIFGKPKYNVEIEEKNIENLIGNKHIYILRRRNFNCTHEVPSLFPWVARILNTWLLRKKHKHHMQSKLLRHHIAFKAQQMITLSSIRNTRWHQLSCANTHPNPCTQLKPTLNYKPLIYKTKGKNQQ